MPVKEIFKTYTTHGRKYQIRIYPPAEDRYMEALKLIINARQLFFSIAEDDIGVPPAHYIDEDKTRINMSREEIAEKAVNVCLAHSEEFPGDKFANAKLCGAYVNLLGLLAEELTVLIKRKKHLTGEVMFAREVAEDAQLADLKEQATYNIKQYAAELNICEAEELSAQKRMNRMIQEIKRLLPNIRLKNRKADIDGVLKALLGEVFKPSVQANEIVHDGEYKNVASAMYQVDIITEWMHSLIKRNPKLTSCYSMVTELGILSKERLNLRREDFAARNKEEIKIRQVKRAIDKELAKCVGEHNDKASLAADKAASRILIGTDLLYEMLKQGQKKISAAILIGNDQSASLINHLHTFIKLMVPKESYREIKPLLRTLEGLSDSYLRRLYNKGEPSIVRTRKLHNAMDALESFTFSVSPSMTPQEREDIAEAGKAVKEGLTVLKEIPGINFNRLCIIDANAARNEAQRKVQDFSHRYTVPARKLLRNLLTEIVHVKKEGNNYRVSATDSMIVDQLEEALKQAALQIDEHTMSIERKKNHIDIKNPLNTVAIELRRAWQQHHAPENYKLPTR